MRSWMKIAVALVFSVSSLTATPARSQSLPSLASLSKALPTNIGADDFKAYMRTDFWQKNVIRFVDKDGRIVQEYHLKEATASALAETMPSSIAKSLKGITTFAGNIAAQKLILFPRESLGFLLSLGALMTWDLITTASKNPVAYEQLISQQMDPVGSLAFYTFMFTNGIAAEPFMAMVRNGKINPRFAPFITYGGMSIGLMASSIVHEISAWPGLKNCARSLFRTQDNHVNCDEAMKEWIKRGRAAGVAEQWTPSLQSLIASTFVSGLLMNGLIRGKAILAPGTSRIVGVVFKNFKVPATVSKVVLTGVQIAIAVAPGAGLIVKGILAIPAFVTWVGRNILFNIVQLYFMEPFFIEWDENDDQGDKLKNLDQQLLYSLANIKTSKWDNHSGQHLAKLLSDFRTAMMEWRQMNKSQVLIRQANWEQKFGAFSATYKAADFFYTDFVGRLWEKKFGPAKEFYQDGSAISAIDRIYPLNGVTPVPAAIPEADATTYLENPKTMEDRQLEKIEIVTARFMPPFHQLTDQENQFWGRFLTNLRSQDIHVVGQALDKLNCYLGIRGPVSCTEQRISRDLYDLMKALRKDLGDPRPRWKKGLGYMNAYFLTPAHTEDLKKAPFRTGFGFIVTPSFTESMIGSMVYGPDPETGNSSLDSTSFDAWFGFRDFFAPPRILKPNLGFKPVKIPTSFGSQEPDVFDSGVYDILTPDNIRPTVLSTEFKTFREWWKKYPETDYMKAWIGYEKLYQENIALLVEKFYASDSFVQSANDGPVDNGLLPSYQQELRLYLMILGELMKDNELMGTRAIFDVHKAMGPDGKSTTGNPLPDEIYSPGRDPKPFKGNYPDPSLLAYLKLSGNMDLPTYLRLEKIHFLPQLDSGKGRNLQWQNKTMALFNEILVELKKVKPQEIEIPNGEIVNMPVSTLNRENLDKIMKELDEHLQSLEKTSFKRMKNQGQAMVFVYAMGQLKSLVHEVKSLGEIIDAASYVKRHNDKGHTQKRCVNTPASSVHKSSLARMQGQAEGC